MALNTISSIPHDRRGISDLSSLDEDLWDFTEIPLRTNFGDDGPNDVIMVPSDTGNNNLNDVVSDKVDPSRASTCPTEDQQGSARDLVGPSCIAGAVVGLVLGGPILAVVVGLGSAHAARNDGRAGDVARAMGETVLYIQSTGQAWEDQHHVLRDMQSSISRRGDSQVIGRVCNVMQKGWKSAVQLNQRHKWAERGMEVTGRRLKDLSGKIQSMSDRRQQS